MSLAALHLSAAQSAWPFIAAFFVLVGLVAWAYGRSAGSRQVRLTCTALKVLGIAALVLCLLEPLWTTKRARPGANYFLVVADNSRGMQIHDRQSPRSRGEQMKGLLTGTGAEWQEPITENFQVRRYAFDSRLQSVTEFGDLDSTAALRR
jgi:di/tricarboxylate transporter